MYYAHSTEDEGKEGWHLLKDHLIGTADKAEAFGCGVGIHKAAHLAGLLHDLGKYTKAFQAKITDKPDFRVDHSTAGAVEVRGLVSTPQDRGVAELIAFAIAGHHAGLADWIGDGSLRDRLKRELEPLDPLWRHEIMPDTNGLMPDFRWIREEDRFAFQLAFLGRMIFSCLVDADYRDTEEFYCTAKGETKDRDWPALSSVVDGLISRLDNYMTEIKAGAGDTDVNRLRANVLSHVRAQAERDAGFYTLTVPTGGGKTLTSLAFALDHAKTHKLERIIYAIPFTSVIDQTANVFRDVLGSEHILEHHSAIDEQKIGNRQQQDKLRLAMEDWAAPVVVTTNVQFFESLYSNRPSRCRKLHNLARSVIVLDEAQTIPWSQKTASFCTRSG